MYKIIIAIFALSVLSLVGANPAFALEYLNTYPEYVYFWDGTAYISETGDAQSDVPGDIYLGQTAGIGATALYVGSAKVDTTFTRFDELYINVTSSGELGGVAWEYRGEGGWLTLDTTVNEADNFLESGWKKVSWEIPDDWLGAAVNVKDALWIRVRTMDSYGVLPFAGQIEMRAYNVRVKVVDSSDEPITDLVEVNFDIRDCDDTTLYGLRNLGSGIYELALNTRGDDYNCNLDVSRTGWQSSGHKETGTLDNRVTDLTPNPYVLTLDTAVSASQSTVSASPVRVMADGTEESTVTVTVKNSSGAPIPGKEVKITSSRAGLDTITIIQSPTDDSGQATFKIKSQNIGDTLITAEVGGLTLESQPTITFAMLDISFGSLIKIKDDGNAETTHDTAVYYYASDGKRYVFPNDKVYFSWYEDFSQVQEITAQEMSDIMLSGNITYRPGHKMLKIQTDPKAYAVSRSGVLRWVTTEEIAQELYGDQWNTMIDDVNIAFWTNYTFGDDIAEASDYDPQAEYDSAVIVEKNSVTTL